VIVLADGRGEWHCGRIVPTVKRSLIHQDVTGLAEVDLSSGEHVIMRGEHVRMRGCEMAMEKKNRCCLVAFIHEHRSQQVAIADN